MNEQGDKGDEQVTLTLDLGDLALVMALADRALEVGENAATVSVLPQPRERCVRALEGVAAAIREALA